MSIKQKPPSIISGIIDDIGYYDSERNYLTKQIHALRITEKSLLNHRSFKFEERENVL